MNAPQRTWTEHSSRRSLHLAVAINSLGGIYVHETTGTSYPGYVPPTEQYFTEAGTPAKKLVSSEYVDVVKGAISHFSNNATFRSKRRRAILVHDRSPLHKSDTVLKSLEEMRLQHILSPTRSPDLDPLDYGIFGWVRRKMEDYVNADWSDRVTAFKKFLMQAPVKKTIQQLPLRLKAGILCEGGHIEEQLRELKKEGASI